MIYLPHRLVAQQVLQGVAAEAASRARVRLARTIGAHSTVDGSCEGGHRGRGEDQVVREPLGRILVRIPECTQYLHCGTDVHRLETDASRRCQERGYTRAKCVKARKLTCGLCCRRGRRRR